MSWTCAFCRHANPDAKLLCARCESGVAERVAASALVPGGALFGLGAERIDPRRIVNLPHGSIRVRIRERLGDFVFADVLTAYDLTRWALCLVRRPGAPAPELSDVVQRRDDPGGDLMLAHLQARNLRFEAES